ncbi:hypothetical protein GCM10020369_84440 [Cryptosporangium minutisporangium]|uniref:Uncharacterized protein n=1 Tax=Cryptosporangium minutisporangium TaxID=113569 RepID=A0ABP6TD16_9ACTN
MPPASSAAYLPPFAISSAKFKLMFATTNDIFFVPPELPESPHAAVATSATAVSTAANRAR